MNLYILHLLTESATNSKYQCLCVQRSCHSILTQCMLSVVPFLENSFSWKVVTASTAPEKWSDFLQENMIKKCESNSNGKPSWTGSNQVRFLKIDLLLVLYSNCGIPQKDKDYDMGHEYQKFENHCPICKPRCNAQTVICVHPHSAVLGAHMT
jgi:hypothetical protein